MVLQSHLRDRGSEGGALAVNTGCDISASAKDLSLFLSVLVSASLPGKRKQLGVTPECKEQDCVLCLSLPVDSTKGSLYEEQREENLFTGMKWDCLIFILLCVLQQQRLEHLEEKLRLMTESRDEAQNCCLKQKEMVAEAQAKAKQLSLYADGLKRRLEELQQVVWTGVEIVTTGPEQVAEVVWLFMDLSLCVSTWTGRKRRK